MVGEATTPQPKRLVATSAPLRTARSSAITTHFTLWTIPQLRNSNDSTVFLIIGTVVSTRLSKRSAASDANLKRSRIENWRRELPGTPFHGRDRTARREKKHMELHLTIKRLALGTLRKIVLVIRSIGIAACLGTDANIQQMSRLPSWHTLLCTLLDGGQCFCFNHFALSSPPPDDTKGSACPITRIHDVFRASSKPSWICNEASWRREPITPICY